MSETTKDEKAHMDKVQALGCIACRSQGYPDTPAEIHHVNSHYNVLPLCPTHHRVGGLGEAFHAGKRTWQQFWGTEQELLEQVRELIERGKVK